MTRRNLRNEWLEPFWRECFKIPSWSTLQTSARQARMQYTQLANKKRIYNQAPPLACFLGSSWCSVKNLKLAYLPIATLGRKIAGHFSISVRLSSALAMGKVIRVGTAQILEGSAL